MIRLLFTQLMRSAFLMGGLEGECAPRSFSFHESSRMLHFSVVGFVMPYIWYRSAQHRASSPVVMTHDKREFRGRCAALTQNSCGTPELRQASYVCAAVL